MKSISFKKGSHVKYAGKQWRVVKSHSATEVMIEELSTKQREIALITDIKSPEDDNCVAPPKPLEALTPTERAEAERRRKIIEPILNAGRGCTALTKSIALENNVSESTLRRWKKRFEGRRLLSDLAPKRKGRKMPDHLSKKQEDLIQEVIDKYVLTNQRHKMTYVHHQLEKLCRAARVNTPHISTLKRRVDRLPPRLRTKRRHGEQAARHLHDSVKGSFPNANHPLSVVQIDHTPLDIIIVDEEDRLPIGNRIWLTLAVDIFSRMVTGFYMSLDAPSALSVGMCLVHSIQDKDLDLIKFGIEDPWPVWGVMDTIHADNGADFRSQTIADSLAQYGINLEWRPPAKPEFGGHIERLLGSINSEIHALPGTTFSNPQVRGKYNSVKEAKLAFGDVEAIIYNFIVRTYHNRPHRELGMSPLEKWEQGIKKFGHRDRITDTKRLYRDFLPSTKRALQREGITWDGVWYRGDVLQPAISALRYGKDKPYTVRRDPRDISRIYVFDKKLGDYLEVTWKNIHEKPMSLWELRAAKNHAKKQGLGLRGQEAAFIGRQMMHSIAEKAGQKTKAKRNENAKRAVRKAGLKKVSESPGFQTNSPPSTAPTGTGNSAIRLVEAQPSSALEEEDEVITYTDEELKPNWRKW